MAFCRLRTIGLYRRRGGPSGAGARSIGMIRIIFTWRRMDLYRAQILIRTRIRYNFGHEKRKNPALSVR